MNFTKSHATELNAHTVTTDFGGAVMDFEGARGSWETLMAIGWTRSNCS